MLRKRKIQVNGQVPAKLVLSENYPCISGPMKRNKKQPMSTTSQIPSSNVETADLSLPAHGQPLDGVLGRDREGLVPADQLPSAAGVLAELFPPDDIPTPPSLSPAPADTVSSAKQDSAAIASVPTPNTVDEPASSQPTSSHSNEVADSMIPKAELQDVSASESSEAPGQDGMTSALSAQRAEQDGSQSSGEATVSPGG